MPGEPSRRVERLNELLRDEISDLIRRELRDPRLAGLISITEVDTASDLSSAKVFFSVMGSDEDRKAALAALRGATGYFRRMLLPRLRLRRVPELIFHGDKSIERGERVLGLLRQIAADEAARARETGTPADTKNSEEAPATGRDE